MRYIVSFILLILGFQPSIGFSSDNIRQTLRQLNEISGNLQNCQDKMTKVQNEMNRAVREWERLQQENNNMRKEINDIKANGYQRHGISPDGDA